jgi:hypothetical protein
MRALLRSHGARPSVLLVAAALVLVTAGVAVGTSIHVPKIITPKTEGQITNIDVLRLEIKNYYGTPGASTGSAASGWTLPLNLDSNYAKEAESVAASGWRWLASQAKSHAPSGMKAIVLDVDDTTLTTYNYELYSNWDYVPATNATFVFGQYFPATPGMVDMVQKAHDAGYAIFFITGRGQSQEQATLGNLTDDTTAALPNPDPRDVDAGYPAPTTIHLQGGGTVDGLFTKPSVENYPAYLNQPQFCAAAIAAGTSCATIQYKSGTRAYIESLGYEIVANFGDQYSDLIGGYAEKTFKLPNPNYYLP